tara:strand:+ start:134 stop:607 length:474 start_codon:yes stop_codon:yes gene_type:complete
MKNLLLTFLAIAVIFAACEKEEEPTATTNPTPTTTTYDFSCKVGGDVFTDNSPTVEIDPSTNVFILDAENGGNTIRMIIYNFSDRNVGEEISLNYGAGISGAYVTKDGVDYTNTQSGKLVFTKIDTELSGTFNFTSTSPSTGGNKSVTEGEFVDLTY